MTVVVTPPFPFFLDRVGAALDAGFVYVGLPNQNAQANPVAIFWDAAETESAPNPVRTFAGYLNNNGSPGNIFTADDYSILITDKRGILVFSSPSTARTGLGDITLSAGEKLTMESGSTLQINDGAAVAHFLVTGIQHYEGVLAQIPVTPGIELLIKQRGTAGDFGGADIKAAELLGDPGYFAGRYAGDVHLSQSQLQGAL